MKKLILFLLIISFSMLLGFTSSTLSEEEGEGIYLAAVNDFWSAGGMDELLGVPVTGSSKWLGVSVVSGVSCPAFYADANVTFSWDGQNADAKDACDASGNNVDGTLSVATLDTNWGEGGADIGIKISDPDQYLEWTDITADEDIDDVGPQTVWLRIYADAAPDGNMTYFEGVNSANDYVRQQTYSGTAGRPYGWWQGGATFQSATKDVTVAATWFDVVYTWDPVNDNHDSGYDTGGGVQWSGASDGELTADAMDGNITSIALGEHYAGGQDPGAHYIYVTKFVIIDGYKAGKPTNW